MLHRLSGVETDIVPDTARIKTSGAASVLAEVAAVRDALAKDSEYTTAITNFRRKPPMPMREVMDAVVKAVVRARQTGMKVEYDHAQMSFLTEAAQRAADVFQNPDAPQQPGRPPTGGLLLHGSPGTGKTETTKCFMMILGQFGFAIKTTKCCYRTCAAYGNAAKNIGGLTLAREFAFGTMFSNTSKRTLPLSGQNINEQRDKYEGVRVLIVDEISCVDPNMLWKVDQRLREYKKSSDPFGGLLVVAVGDFFQIPPVGAPSLADDQTEARRRRGDEKFIDNFDMIDL